MDNEVNSFLDSTVISHTKKSIDTELNNRHLMTSIEEDVLWKISTSLKSLCGGGIKTTNTIPGCNCHCSIRKFKRSNQNDGNGKNDKWLSHLESLAQKSISYPNGRSARSSSSNSACVNVDDIRSPQAIDDNIGKPHDVEIKLALSFFHRYRHKCIKYFPTATASQRLSPAKEDVQDDNETHSSYEHTPPPLEITSDTGLVRSIHSPNELATLLANNLEDLIWHERQQQNHDRYHSQQQQQQLLLNSNSYTYSIRVDRSGMICMVTPNRVEYLRKIGRISCSYCTKWVKGEKGLWWHCQKEHNLDHSVATAIASSSTGIHEYSMVIYRNPTKDDARIMPQNISSDMNVVDQKKEDPYFQIIKSGNLQQFIKYLDENKIDVIAHNDRNGASALHWASGSGHTHLVKFLIEQKDCPPDQGQAGKRSFRNRTPLHWACRNGHLDIVKYLVEECQVDMDAVTIDGTTAFCWSCWQGHEDVMRYLYSKGANTEAINMFGCNAVLWSAQSTVSSLDAIQWLKSIGSNMYLVNSNGHGILHKSAQRGKDDVCRWVFETLYNQQYTCSSTKEQDTEEECCTTSVDLLKQIGPDAEGCCPSDLAGMGGFESLARWLVTKEQHIGMSAFISNPSTFPLWLKIGLENSIHKSNTFGLDDIFEKNAGVKKICANIVQATRKRNREGEHLLK